MVRVLALLVLVPGFHAFRLQGRSSSLHIPTPATIIKRALLASKGNLSSNVQAKSAHAVCPKGHKMLKGLWRSKTYETGDEMEMLLPGNCDIKSFKRRGTFEGDLAAIVEGNEITRLHFKDPMDERGFIRVTGKVKSMAFLDQSFELTCHFCGQPCIYPDYNADKIFGGGGSGILSMEAPACPVQDMAGSNPIAEDKDARGALELLPDDSSTHIYVTWSAFKSEGVKMFDTVLSMWYECSDFAGTKKDSKQAEEELDAMEEEAAK